MIKKYFAYALLASAIAGAADFTTGQAARAVFGQQTFTAQDEDTGTGGGACGTQVCQPTPYILGGVGGVAYANNTLVVADSNRLGALPLYERVLIYTNINQALPPPMQPISLPPVPFVRCPLCIGTALTALNVKTLGGFPAAASLPSGTITPNYSYYGITAQSFRTPTAVATDGTMLAVADTDNNRILIWKSIPNSDGIPADLVLGQPDFNTVHPVTVDNKSFRGPQGVWIQGTRLFVADTQNNRIMIWNNIPTTNYQAADLVLGASNFTTPPQPDLTKNTAPASASNMLSPVSVTSDGVRLFVTDLGQNRILIWNSIPTQNGQAADVEIGQPDMKQSVDNNSYYGTSASTSTDTNKETPVLCTVPAGTDAANNNTFPLRCAYTLSFPRFALSDGTRLFVADGGNDRVLVFNQIPTQNAQRADIILGQATETDDIVTDSTDTFRPDANVGRSSADSVRTPTALAWDGTNLYVTDPFDRRVMVFTPGNALVPLNGIVNSASRNVNAVGTVDVTGTITTSDTATISIGTDINATPIAYTYTVQASDTIETIVQALVNLINTQNGGDPNVLAIANVAIDEIVLTSRPVGALGNSITLAVSTTGAGSTSTTTNAATIVLTSSSSTLSGGGSAGEIAPGTLVTLFAAPGQTLADHAVSAAPPPASLPTTLGGVEVYFDGLKIPLSYVGPGQINAQMPYEVLDTSSVSAYVRITHDDGSVTISSAIGIPVVGENPGIFAYEGSEPRQVIAFHASSNALAVVDLEGTIQAGDTATIGVDGRTYSYNIQSTDTIDSVRDALVALINADPEERVTATAAGQYDRVVLTAKVPGPDGDGIPITGTETSTVTAGATITVTALQAQTGGASVAGAPVTQDNPATPGELISIYATGLGVIGPSDAQNYENDGAIYPLDGPPNSPTAPVDNAQVGGKTATVLFSGLKPGMIGVYEVKMLLDVGLATNLQTQMYIAQDVFTSNIVTIPIVAPTPPVSQ